MYNDRLVQMLLHAADSMNDLAARMTDSQVEQRPLTQRERQLCRAATLPVVQEICDGIILNHLQGMAQDGDNIVNELRSVEVL